MFQIIIQLTDFKISDLEIYIASDPQLQCDLIVQVANKVESSAIITYDQVDLIDGISSKVNSIQDGIVEIDEIIDVIHDGPRLVNGNNCKYVALSKIFSFSQRIYRIIKRYSLLQRSRESMQPEVPFPNVEESLIVRSIHNLKSTVN